jgi:hypothetical protein
LGVLSWYIGRKREGFGEMKSGDWEGTLT